MFLNNFINVNEYIAIRMWTQLNYYELFDLINERDATKQHQKKKKRTKYKLMQRNIM